MGDVHVDIEAHYFRVSLRGCLVADRHHRSGIDIADGPDCHASPRETLESTRNDVGFSEVHMLLLAQFDGKGFRVRLVEVVRDRMDQDGLSGFPSGERQRIGHGVEVRCRCSVVSRGVAHRYVLLAGSGQLDLEGSRRAFIDGDLADGGMRGTVVIDDGQAPRPTRRFRHTAADDLVVDRQVLVRFICEVIVRPDTYLCERRGPGWQRARFVEGFVVAAIGGAVGAVDPEYDGVGAASGARFENRCEVIESLLGHRGPFALKDLGQRVVIDDRACRFAFDQRRVYGRVQFEGKRLLDLADRVVRQLYTDRLLGIPGAEADRADPVFVVMALYGGAFLQAVFDCHLHGAGGVQTHRERDRRSLGPARVRCREAW